MPRVSKRHSLQTTHPELLKEWDYTRNILRPSEYTSGTNTVVWWVCKNGANVANGANVVSGVGGDGGGACGCHVWEASIAHRVGGSGCPFCSGHKVCEHSSLAVTHPHLVEEWSNDNTKTPNMVTSGSEYKASWICKSGACGCHKWTAYVYSRAGNKKVKGSGCPYCARKRICIHTSLAGTHPELVEQWSSDNLKTPDTVSSSSKIAVSWTCSWGHKWRATPAKRVYNPDCPFCKDQGHQGHQELLEAELMDDWLNIPPAGSEYFSL